MLQRLQRVASGTRQPWDDALIDAVRGPARLVWWLLLGSLLFTLMPVLATYHDMALPALRIALLLLLPWFLHRLIGNVEALLVELRYRSNSSADRATLRATARLLRIALWTVTLLMVLQTFGVSVSGLLAFGGIGGIAVGFAAKDLLANFFGGLGIFLDRPFTIGDWIRSPDRSLEGVVEDIGWRVTRIRTFDKRPLYVPNAVFGQITLENPSRMQNRRIFERFGLRYQDARSLPAVIAAIDQMLRDHEAVDAQQTVIVNFESFGSSSLDCFMYCYTLTTDWVEYHGIKQDVMLRVLQLVHEHGADIAFPTRSVRLEDLREGEPL